MRFDIGFSSNELFSRRRLACRRGHPTWTRCAPTTVPAVKVRESGGSYNSTPTCLRFDDHDLPRTDHRAPGHAQALLLEPFGLDESHLRARWPRSPTHKVDYADLYFQYTRSEGWSLEEGIVKTGSFNIDQGVGVRAVTGEKTAFAYSDEISSERAAGCGAQGDARDCAAGQSPAASRSPPRKLAAAARCTAAIDPIASLRQHGTRSRCSRRSRQLAAPRDPRVTQVMASLGGEYDVVLVARADGRSRPTCARWCASRCR